MLLLQRTQVHSRSTKRLVNMTVADRPTGDDGDASLLNKDTFCFTITTCQPVYNHYPPTAL